MTKPLNEQQAILDGLIECHTPEELEDYKPTAKEVQVLEYAYDAVMASTAVWQKTHVHHEVTSAGEVTRTANTSDAVIGLVFSLGHATASLPMCTALWRLIVRVHDAKHVHVAKLPDSVPTALDPINDFLWDNWRYPDYHGVGLYDIPVSPRNKEDVVVSLAIDELAGDLTPFDRSVCEACAARWNDGTFAFRATSLAIQIYKTTPNQKQIDAVVASVKRMMGMVVTIDNEQEHIKYGRVLFQQTRNVIYAVITKGVVNGQYVDDLIQLLEMPIPINYAISVKQIANVPTLIMPISITEKNIRLYQYLRKRVLTNRRPYKAAWTTIYDQIGDAKPKHAGRIKQDVHTVMDSFAADGLIKSWSEYDKGVEWKRPKK